MIARLAMPALVVLLSLAAWPARADAAHLLPFWGRPYPSGYTRSEPDCIVTRRVETRHGPRTTFIDRCGAVLHARD